MEGYADRISVALQEKRRAIVSHAAFVKKTLNERQENDIESAGREFAQKLSTQLGELRNEIESAMRNGGGEDEINALLDGSNVPIQICNRMSDDAARRGNRNDPPNWTDTERRNPNSTPTPQPTPAPGERPGTPAP